MHNRLFLSGNETYSNYRIPGMTVSARGTLLAYFEARRSAGDWANMDILLFRSEDGGDSFSDSIVLARGTEALPTVNNPVCIAEPDGALHFLFCRNYAVDGGGVFYRRSDDDGKTWSEETCITASTRPELHNVFACGPGHGIYTSRGLLLVPVWTVLKEHGAPLHAHRPAVISTLYSADHGKTWQLGDILPETSSVPDPNETQAAELPDGSIYLNVRSTGAGFRARAWSETGHSGWTPLTLDPALPDPTCFGSVVRYRHGGEDLLLAVNCCHREKRENLVCRASRDGGRTWDRMLTVEPGDAGYADIAVLPDGDICVLYEQSFGIREHLARFSLSALMTI